MEAEHARTDTAVPMRVGVWVASILTVMVAGAVFLFAVLAAAWEGDSGSPMFEPWEAVGQLSLATFAIVVAAFSVHFASRQALGRVLLLALMALAITAAWWRLANALAW